jgi:predicted nucleotidyltransferase
MDAAAILTEEEIRAALAALKERLGSLLGRDLVQLRLFGSRARGDADPDSDVDVAIVFRSSDAGMKVRILDAVARLELETGVPLSTLIIPEEEYRQLLERERRLALDIESEGVSI